MTIKLFTICMVSVFLVEYVAGEHCYGDIQKSCSASADIAAISNCHSKYGAFKDNTIMVNLQGYANSYISKSFQFLLMSSYFGNYVQNRAGLEKLYRKLSDEAWEQSIDLVKYIGKRGGHMNFSMNVEKKNFVYEMYELESMAQALDMQKNLAEGANSIHASVTHGKEEKYHDSEVASYLENNFVHQQSDIIRKLAGYTNDLKHLFSNQVDWSLSLYLFDEYLQKTV